ncbi:MAG TPA: trigger factor [Burkholderiaceae bacterium]|nr:trigger factor [Burkholderiaceae bacterium]
MQQNIESIGRLERRLDLSVPTAEIAAEVAQRLARLARESNMPGFRRGKVPVKMIARTHGAQVQAEVLNDKVGSLLSRALEENKLRLAGRPQIESKADGDAAHQNFRATFEVYPEVGPIDATRLSVQKATCSVGTAEVERTIEVMRRQRATFTPVTRGARDGDRIKLDFHGTIEGTDFDGGSAKGYSFELGRGRMLPEFEEAVRGAVAGATRRFPLHFPQDYHGAAVAGKTAQFEITVHSVEERSLPPADEDFARSVGVANGSLDALRGEVRSNVEREVTARLRARTRNSVLDALLGAAQFDVPRTLVAAEQERLRYMAQAEIAARGGTHAPESQVFAEAAQRRVRLSLIVSEIVRSQGLQARPDQVRKAIESIARGYEKPHEVVQWYLGDRARLAEVEASVVEDNVIDWVLARAQVSDLAVAFDDLMDNAKE